MKKSTKLLNFKIQFSKIMFLSVLFSNFICSAQLPVYLELDEPKIQGDFITAEGTVWNTQTQEVILSVDYETKLGSNIVFYSDESVTYLHNNSDGALIAEIPGVDYNYNSFSSYLWNYDGQSFNAYSESGDLIMHIDNLIAENIYPYQNQIRYIRNNSLFEYSFTELNEQSLTDFEGNFRTWFFDGEYFLTGTGATITRLYQKNGTFVKIIETPNGGLNGFGEYFWLRNSGHLNIYNVNDDNVVELFIAGTNIVYNAGSSLALFPFGESSFSIIDFNDNLSMSEHQGAGAYLQYYHADMNGNWTTVNSKGVVNYGNFDVSIPPQKLNHGRIRHMFGNKNGHFAIATSAGKVLLYELFDEELLLVHTYDIDSDKVKISLNGDYIAIKGSAADAQYSSGDQSLSIYETSSHYLVKQWYYNNFLYDGSPILRDFDFSQDATKVILNTAINPGNFATYTNYLLSTFSDDTVIINSDNINRFGFSNDSNILTTTRANINLSKMYQSGTLTNAYNLEIIGWLNDSFFVANSGVGIEYHSNIYNISGNVDTSSFTFPPVVTTVIEELTSISDFEFLTNDSYVTQVRNLVNGTTLFTLGGNYRTVPVGTDHLVYIKDNAFEMVNWRSPLSIDETNIDEIKPKVYPNPTTNSITIDVPNFMQADITDITGKLIATSFNPNIDLTKFSSGIYIISINKGSYFHKIIKK